MAEWINQDAFRALLEQLGTKEMVNPSEPDGYAAGLLDALLMFGLVELRAGAAHPAGERAGLFIRSMAAHLSDGLPLALDWETGLEGNSAAQGSQLLAEVEALRKDAVARPTPVREVSAVNGIILKREGGETLLFMQYDDKAQQYQLLGGKVEPEDEGPAATLLRELQEELERPELRIPDHLLLEPLDDRFEKITMSPTFGVVTSYTIRFYYVHGLKIALPVDALNQWVRLDEVRRGVAADGRKISDLPLIFADALGTLPPSIL